MYQDVLDQMSAEIDGIRPAVLGKELSDSLGELKAFRHLVRHRYGFDLNAAKVRENVERMKQAFPMVVSTIVSLEKELVEEHADDNEGGDGTGGGASGGP